MSALRPLAPGAALAAAVVLAGCGGTGDPTHAVTSAARLTLRHTVAASFTLTAAPQLGVGAGVRGKADLLPDGVSASGLFVPDAHGGASATQYLFFRPAFAYFSVGSSASALVPAGKTIVSVPVSGSAARATGTVAAEVEGLNLQLVLEELAWGVVSATNTGHQVVAQLPLERYSVSVSLRQALADVSGPDAAAMRHVLGAELAASTASKGLLRATVWIDGPGRVARIETPLPGLRLGTITAVFSDYGVKLSEPAQPPALVVPLASLQAPAGKADQSPLVTFGLGR